MLVQQLKTRLRGMDYLSHTLEVGLVRLLVRPRSVCVD
jgi:hypothetical protein